MRSRNLLVVLLVVAGCAALAWVSLRGIERSAQAPGEAYGALGPEGNRSGAVPEAASPDRFADERDMRGSGVLAGVVVRDGEPVAAQVDIWFWFGPRPEDAAARRAFELDTYFRESDPRHPAHSATAAGDGTFRFERLRDGTYGLLAVAEDGRFEIQGLPPGTWPVQASATVAGRRAKVRVQAGAGTSIEIDLR